MGETANFEMLFSNHKLAELFPPEKTDRFFDALLGDAREGAYDIRLAFNGVRENQLLFDIELHQRRGKCLACNLTYGLPTVFSRHPVIDLQGMVEQICGLLADHGRCRDWKLGATRELDPRRHAIALTIAYEPLTPLQKEHPAD